MDLVQLDTGEVSSAVGRSGYAVAAGCLEDGALGTMREEFSTAFDRLPSYDYPFGDQFRIPVAKMRPDWVASMPVTTEVMLSGPIAEVCDGYGADEGRDLLVWSREFNRDQEAIYGIPHFDRRHQLKVFIYLTDVGEDNGPTHVAAEDPSHFHSRWIGAWRSALEMRTGSDFEVLERVRRVSEDSSTYRSVACEVDIPRRSFRPLVGNAGTIVFFDTSLAHFGGLISGSATRQTVRRHCLLD
jgi:hypothetical protein